MDATGPDLDATARFRLDVAPGGLRLIQDLVNTSVPVGAREPDLLQDAATADAWLQAALRAWAQRSGQSLPKARATSRDLRPLRALRDDLRAWLADDTAPLAIREHALAIGVDGGRVSLRPEQSATAAVSALVGLEILLAAQAGTRPRLKVCANPDCGAAFYDNSRNMSRVWHDVKTCGNRANLRASRARRRDTHPA